METSKFSKISYDLRQSPEWAAYLKALGWKTHKLTDDTQLFFKQLGIFGKICKLQRPNKLEIESVENFCTKNNALFIKIEPNVNFDINKLEKNGFKPSKFPLLPPSTALVELKMPLEQLKNSLSSNVRYSIRKAKKDAIEIEFFQQATENQIKQFLGILKSSANKNNIISPTFKNLNSLVKNFGDKSHLALSKNKNGEYTGGNFYLGYKNKAWYMFGGINKLGRKDTSGYRLMWESIKKLRSFGYDFLDLEGIKDRRFPKHTKNWAGFTKFKNKFATHKVQFPKPYVKVYCKILKPFIN